MACILIIGSAVYVIGYALTLLLLRHIERCRRHVRARLQSSERLSDQIEAIEIGEESATGAMLLSIVWPALLLFFAMIIGEAMSRPLIDRIFIPVARAWGRSRLAAFLNHWWSHG